MIIPNRVTVVNQVLNEIGRLAVVQVSDSQDAQLISQKIDTLLPTLLTETSWAFAIQYVSDSTPLADNPFDEFEYAFVLPADFGCIDRFVNQISAYRIIDGYILSNQSPVTYYYVVNNADFSVMTPMFRYTLALLVASECCDVLTNNEQLTMDLRNKYQIQLAKAIQQNQMSSLVVGAPYNDYERVNLV